MRPILCDTSAVIGLVRPTRGASEFGTPHAKILAVQKLGAATKWHDWASRMQSLKSKDEACMNFARVYDAKTLRDSHLVARQTKKAVATLVLQMTQYEDDQNQRLKRIENNMKEEWERLQYEGSHSFDRGTTVFQLILLTGAHAKLRVISDMTHIHMHDIILGNGYDIALGHGRKMGLDYARSGLWLRQHASFSPWFERDVINSKPILWLRGPRQ